MQLDHKKYLILIVLFFIPVFLLYADMPFGDSTSIPAGGKIDSGSTIKTVSTSTAGGTVGAGGTTRAGGTTQSGGSVDSGGGIRSGGSIRTIRSIWSGGSIHSGGGINSGGEIVAGGRINGGGLFPTLNVRLNLGPMGRAPTDFKGLISLFIGIIQLIIPAIGLLSVWTFFKGLAVFIGKSGDEKAIQEGKLLMFWGVVALFVMVSVYGLINILYGSVFGGTITLPLLPQ